MPTVTIPFHIDNIEVAAQKLSDFKAKMASVFDKAIRTAVYRSQKRLRAITPVSKRPWEKTPGSLRRSMRVVRTGLGGIRAEWGEDYASYIDEGTPAHAVTGTPMMHWQPGPGVWGHSKGHIVRGIRPHNLQQQARDIILDELQTALVTLILAEAAGF